VMMGVMTYPTALQDIAPAHLRGRIFAIMGVLSIAFPSAAPPFVGFLSDQLAHRPDGLMLAMVVVSVSSLLGAAAIFAWTAPRHESVVRAAAAAN